MASATETDIGERQKPERNAPIWVKILVGIHLFCITVWAIPAQPEAMKSGRIKPHLTDWILVWNEKYLKSSPPIQTYLFTTGTWQYWDMFAPNPARTDIYGDANIVYRDRTIRHYQYPRMFLLPIPQKFMKERYRKYYERAHDGQYSYLWPQFAQRIALLNYHDPKNPPISVRLYRHWLDVSDPGKPQPEKYSDYCYYEGAVDLARLRKDAGEPAVE